MGRTEVLICLIAAVVVTAACSHDAATVPSFDGARAYADLERQVAFGPRVPGSEAHIETRDWLLSRFRETASRAALQEFSGQSAGREVPMYNIIASFSPEKTARVLLCAHWDCRPFADKDPDPANHTQPVPGANDGASGVAVLLEVARILSAYESPVGVDIVLFDGEDGGSYGSADGWLLGSRHFAIAMPESYKPRYAVLLDMIGDSDLTLSPDAASQGMASTVWNRAERIARDLGINIETETIQILDDHIPLLERGIPAIDLIDFDYPPWHTVGDTPDKCSPESLGVIGSLVLTMIYGE